MRITLSALARWLAIGGLWLLIGLLIVPGVLFHFLNGLTLDVMTALKDRADALLRATD